MPGRLAYLRHRAAQWKQALKTGPSKAVFWSGHTDGVLAQVPAKAHAQAIGGVTLDMAMTDAGIPIPDKPPLGPKRRIQDQRQWKGPSATFAKKTQGDITVFLGKAVKPDSVYNVYEKPWLKKNPKVTSLTEIHHDGRINVVKGQA
jgi:hypothetical protein